MKEIECPICWNKNVRKVDSVYQKNQDMIKPLMFCDLCEEYYWGDTNGIVTNLSIFCETFNLSPKFCHLKEENSYSSKSVCLSKRKLQEFNLLCGSCPYRQLQLKSGVMSVERAAK